MTARKVAIGKLIRIGLNAGVLEPINEITSDITEAYIVNDLAATAISKVLFDGADNRSYDGLLAGVQRCLRSGAFISVDEDDLAITSTKVQPDDIVVDIDGYHALSDTALKQQSTSGTHSPWQAAILRKLDPATKDCGKAGCRCRHTFELYRIVESCIMITGVTPAAVPGQKYSIM